MRDPPLAIYFAIANGRAHPDIGFLAACPLPTDPARTCFDFACFINMTNDRVPSGHLLWLSGVVPPENNRDP